MVWKSEIGSVRKRKDFFSAHPKVPTTSANKNEIYVLSTFSAFLRIGGNVIDSGANDAPTGSERLLPLDFFKRGNQIGNVSEICESIGGEMSNKSRAMTCAIKFSANFIEIKWKEFFRLNLSSTCQQKDTFFKEKFPWRSLKLIQVQIFFNV